MKTPDEIKKGLECCCGMHDHSYCRECPYSENDCDEMSRDALAYIQQIERERDAAVEDMTELMKGSESCEFCKHYVEDGDYCSRPPTSIFTNGMCWQWRGAEVE